MAVMSGPQWAVATMRLIRDEDVEGAWVLAQQELQGKPADPIWCLAALANGLVDRIAEREGRTPEDVMHELGVKAAMLTELFEKGNP